MKKIILPLSILLLTVISLKSQNAGISPSPNSSALCSSVSSVNLYTGVPSINLPLYKLQTKEFSLPISLSYNASGIKVEQVASWVGLGWSLNAGGVVTRVVNGSPDDVRGCFTGDITSQV
ncbi:MAG: hypothetical protein KAT68_06365, partial [Bacteroidales bacterium]|nr:hypothetical protein [Bacteroidales bacterium]